MTVVVIPLDEDDVKSLPPQRTAAMEPPPVIPHFGQVYVIAGDSIRVKWLSSRDLCE